ncbi:MAG: Ig-like domain-containing protein [Gemmatimonadota bacterium]
MSLTRRVSPGILLATLMAIPSTSAWSQETPVVRLVAEPAQLVMNAGEERPLRVTGLDAAGNPVPGAAIRVGGPRQAVFYEDGLLRAFRAGEHTVVATWSGAPGTPPVTLEIPVTVGWPAVTRLEVEAEPGALYTGVMKGHTARGFHADGLERPQITPDWSSSNPSVASADRFGNVTAHTPGDAVITATFEGATARLDYAVRDNPVASIRMDIAETTLSTGDVIHLKASALDAQGREVPDAPLEWSYSYIPHDTLEAPGAAGILDWGRFAANHPGRYTVVANSGNAVARHVLEVSGRDVWQRFTVTGQGPVTSTATSDLWPWEGADGRDYAVVGTWGGGGWALIFDITDPSNIFRTDSVQIDARTINDVTVSPSARYAVLSREGASNRVNGVVILDISNPAHPTIASTFDYELTGGVHNMFATDDHLFAISGGQKYIIIDMSDIYNPRYVSEYRHPNARIHDLWVHEGIAYSAQGGVGIVVVDVGNGRWGGTIENPVLINTVPLNTGHEIYPYVQETTGKVYLFAGDEVMNRAGRVWEGTDYRATLGSEGGIAQTSAGYTHIVDFTDPMNPRKVARYHLEDYGTHDIIVENDILYQAYYDGGVRIVDVSGELLGNLAEQGREIAVFKPYDPQGFTANAPFVMNAMPYKGHIFFTDFNSGLWGAKLEPRERTVF